MGAETPHLMQHFMWNLRTGVFSNLHSLFYVLILKISTEVDLRLLYFLGFLSRMGRISICQCACLTRQCSRPTQTLEAPFNPRARRMGLDGILCYAYTEGAA